MCHAIVGGRGSYTVLKIYKFIFFYYLFAEVIQFVIICQMCALSIWALKLYQRPNQYDVTDATHNTTPNGQSSLLDKCSVTCVDLNDQRPINGTSY